MNACVRILVVGALVVATASSRGETPAKSEKKVDLIVVGKVHDLTVKESKLANDRVLLRWLAEVVVTDVERGKGALIGEKLNIRWSEVNDKPDLPLPSPSGYLHRMKADDVVRFRLMKDGTDWQIIDNPRGVKILK